MLGPNGLERVEHLHGLGNTGAVGPFQSRGVVIAGQPQASLVVEGVALRIEAHQPHGGDPIAAAEVEAAEPVGSQGQVGHGRVVAIPGGRVAGPCGESSQFGGLFLVGQVAQAPGQQGHPFRLEAALLEEQPDGLIDPASVVGDQGWGQLRARLPGGLELAVLPAPAHRLEPGEHTRAVGCRRDSFAHANVVHDHAVPGDQAHAVEAGAAHRVGILGLEQGLAVHFQGQAAAFLEGRDAVSPPRLDEHGRLAVADAAVARAEDAVGPVRLTPESQQIVVTEQSGGAHGHREVAGRQPRQGFGGELDADVWGERPIHQQRGPGALENQAAGFDASLAPAKIPLVAELTALKVVGEHRLPRVTRGRGRNLTQHARQQHTCDPHGGNLPGFRT